MDRDSPWSRRTSSKSSFSKADGQPRGFGPSKRYVSSDSLSRANGAAAVTATTTTAAAASPAGSSAFGLGSGAFAAFGSTATSGRASKGPGGPGVLAAGAATSTNPSSTSPPTDGDRAAAATGGRAAAGAGASAKEQTLGAAGGVDAAKPWPLKHTWVTWYRPPAVSKSADYEKSIKPVYRVSSAQEFWRVYAHLKRPSALPVVSDYHFFKDGIRPVWEDEANRRGGKWIMRFKKGVMDRYWDELLLATVGDQFTEAGEEVCGMVVSVRNGEDVLSVWTRNDGGRNVKIRETIKRILNLPADTVIVWKSHDDSIAQKSAVEQARQDKGEKRRNTLQDGPGEGKERDRERERDREK